MPALAHLFCEIVTSAMKASTETEDTESLLHAMGVRIGMRSLDSLYFKEKPFRRETKLLSFLQFLVGPAWKQLFGRTADLSISESGLEYYITDKALVLNRWLSPPTDSQDIPNCGGAMAAGIAEGMLQRAGHTKLVYATFLNESTGEDWCGTVLVVKDRV